MTKSIEIKKKRNIWGKTPPGTTAAVNFYGHQDHPDGIVAYFRIKLNKRVPFKQALPLAQALLPTDFMQISTVKGGELAFRYHARGGKIEQLAPNIQVSHHHNAA